MSTAKESDLPVIAILGDVNHGKSSVVATLAEDDSVRIGPFPTTTQCQQFRVRDLFEFVDTPGFQNAREALHELKQAASHNDPRSVFQAFVERHANDRFFVHECRLLEPVIAGASLLYVVDVSQPMEPRHDAEMEILRLTGAPRIALLNQTGEPGHRAAWEARLRQNFSTVIDFNAHRADFANRLALLEALATVDIAGKEKLRAAIKVLQKDRDEKLDSAARIIIDLLSQVLPMKISEPLRDPLDVAKEREELEVRFRKKIIEREIWAHRALVKTFAHRLVSVNREEGAGFLADGLFVEKTWTVLGLNTWQLLAAGAGGGALVGAKIDLMLGGASWGLGAALGAGLGGGAAFAGSRSAPNLSVRLPYFTRQLIGTELTAGPITHENFPWILLDRALGVFVSVSSRAHARRDEEVLDATALAERLKARGASVNQAPDPLRRRLAATVRSIRKGRLDPDQRENVIVELRTWLREISQ
jgi:hypothetical protein